MNKRLLTIVLALIIVMTAFAAGTDNLVYVTKTGEKYHTEECSSLRNSKIEIFLGEAISKGYEPCQLCNPPVLDEKE
jgi:hypothetical protein